MPYINQQIGPYTLIKKIGQGGFGEVWLAEKKTKFVTKNFAVKLPLKEQVDADAVRHEATLWSQASGHPNILPIIDADEFDGQIAIVSEYAPDGSLADLLQKQGRLSVERAVEMIDGILAGLEFLHSRKIIHRDLKPSNIVLQGKIPTITDFKISKVLHPDKKNIEDEIISGTLPYMAPEAIQGKCSEQTDIWSVGVIFYELLCGKLPFQQSDIGSTVNSIFNDEPEPLSTNIPFYIQSIIKKALKKNPINRFNSASEMKRYCSEKIEERNIILDRLELIENKLDQILSGSFPLQIKTEKNLLFSKTEENITFETPRTQENIRNDVKESEFFPAPGVSIAGDDADKERKTDSVGNIVKKVRKFFSKDTK